MPKRTITPHKGNRSESIYFRCTPETAKQIAAILERRNQGSERKVSLADWVAEMAAKEAALLAAATD